MEIIIGRNGTQKLKITDSTVSREHCKVYVNNDGTFIIENLSQSGTKVDGRPIIKASATLNSRLQLGHSYSATLADLIGNPLQPSPQYMNDKNAASTSQQNKQEIKVCNISHLRRVWEDFNNTNIELADKQRKINLIRAGLGILTVCVMPTISLVGYGFGFTLTGIAAFGNLYSFIGMKNAESAEEKQSRQDAFDDAWVCPNCGRSLPAKNYKNLVRNYQSCPYCKCKFVE